MKNRKKRYQSFSEVPIEHSVMYLSGKPDEPAAFSRLISLFPDVANIHQE